MRIGRSSVGSSAHRRSETPPEQGEPEQHRAQQPTAQAPETGPRLGEILVRNEALSMGALEDALLVQSARGQRLGFLLTDLGVISERDLARALAQQADLEVVDLSRTVPDPTVAELLDESLARGLQAIPLTIAEDGAVLVAVSDPSPAIAEEVHHSLNRPVRLCVATTSEVRRAINSTFRALNEIDHQVDAFRAAATAATPAAAAIRTAIRRADMDDRDDDAPVVRIVNLIITQALRDRASDVHIEPQDGKVRVRFRIDGALHDVLALPGEMGPAMASRIKILGGMNIVERRRPQDGQIATSVDGRGIDIRVATMGNVWGEKVVMRLLDKSRSLYRLSDLGMPPETHAATPG